MVDMFETVWEGVCLNKYIFVEIWKETWRVFFIKRYQVTWQISQYPSPHNEAPFKMGSTMCVCVEKRNTKRMTEGTRRENKGTRMRQRERGGERVKKKERLCIGLHIVITYVNVWVTIFATACSFRQAIVFLKRCILRRGHFVLIKCQTWIGQADLRFYRDCENPPPSLFVCRYEIRKSLLYLPSWVRSKPPGSISTRTAQSFLRSYQRYTTAQKHSTCQLRLRHSTSWRVGSHPWTYASPI